MSIRKLAGALSAGAVILALTACTSEAPEPTTIEAVQESASGSPEAAEPTETEEAKPEPGSRENPLKPGQARKLSELSAWTVGATETVQHDGWVQAEFTIGIDWKNLDAQGVRPEGEPFYPFYEVEITFVGTDGTTYDSADVPMEAFGEAYTDPYVEVFEPKKSLTGSQIAAVPEDKVKGGLWAVSNVAGDRIFIAQK